jgi:peroxiredoxin/Flp pilus assembly protein TadD
MKHLATLAAFAALAALPRVAAAEAVTGPQLGSPAPAFSLRTTEGRTVSLADYRGKTLVLNVWATWCPPCRLEMPDLIKSYPGLHAQNVQFLGVDSTELAPIVRAYVVAKGLPYPQAIDTDKSFETAYDIQYFPTTFVIDPQGIVRARYIDILSQKQLTALVADAKAGRNATVSSPLQTKIDGVLMDSALVFDGSADSVRANAKKAAAAIASAEDLLNNSDPAKGDATDLLHTRTEEVALRDRAIAAFATIAATSDEKILLARLQGDAASDREQWSAALEAYRAVLALDPKNTDALSGVAFAAQRLKQDDVALDAEKQLVALQPDSVENLVDLGIQEGHAKQADAAAATFAQAVALGEKHVKADGGKPATVRRLSWTYLYAGRTFAKLGDPAHAKSEFEAALAVARTLPAKDERHDMYIEEDQEAIVALGLSGNGSTSVTLAPWTGTDLPGSIPNTIKYRLVVAGLAGKSVALHAAGVPKGWVASFCSDRVCAPFKVSVAIPQSGVKIIEFQLVPPTAHAVPGKVQVIGNDGDRTAIATT